MRLLLDTHVFLWLVEGSPKLSSAARHELADPRHEFYLSVASIWELVIKTGNGKLTLSDPVEIFVTKWVKAYELSLLTISAADVYHLTKLPDFHRDPFDRMLVSQAVHADMALITADTKMSRYSVRILW